MARITFVTNANRVVEAADGGTLLHASLRHQGGIPFKCGGGICGNRRAKCLQFFGGGLDAVLRVLRETATRVDFAFDFAEVFGDA